MNSQPAQGCCLPTSSPLLSVPHTSASPLNTRVLHSEALTAMSPATASCLHASLVRRARLPRSERPTGPSTTRLVQSLWPGSVRLLVPAAAGSRARGHSHLCKHYSCDKNFFLKRKVVQHCPKYGRIPDCSAVLRRMHSIARFTWDARGFAPSKVSKRCSLRSIIGLQFLSMCRAQWYVFTIIT